MRQLHFELIGGISGDMVVAALLDSGLSLETLRRELSKIRVGGYVLRKSTVRRGHVRAVKFDCIVRKKRNYAYKEIQRSVRASRLSARVKEKILKVYEILAQAEVRAHGHRHAEIRFEQLGDIDTIVDIASICIGLDRLGIDAVSYGAIPLNGAVAPATRHLLVGSRVYFTGRIFENVTPTGMAFLKALGRQGSGLSSPAAVAGRPAYGAGTADPAEAANVLAATLLEQEGLATDEIYVLETNIDDMNPQFFEHVFGKLFEAGALDASVASVFMKKNRPGFLLTVLSNGENLGKISNLVLSETTSAGVRFYPCRRLKVVREARAVVFRGRRVLVKGLKTPGGAVRWQPEYDACKAAARRLGVPLQEIYRQVQKIAESRWRSLD